MTRNSRSRRIVRWLARSRLYRSIVVPAVNRLFFHELIRYTRDYERLTWLGQPIKQPVLDLWTIQETIWQLKPDLLIETGTKFGGSAYYYANLFDLIGRGRVISIDIAKPPSFVHPRIEFITGDSADAGTADIVKKAVDSVRGVVMVILDSDHSAHHVLRELEAYCGFVTVNSYMLVEDGMIDTERSNRHFRPGPLHAIREFLKRHPEYVVDHEKCRKFPITHHPEGWLRRVR